MDIINRFQELPFSNAAISSFLMVPPEKILFKIEVVLNEQNLCDDCELQFNRILHYSIKSTGNPWFGIIKDFYITEKSKHIDYVLDNSNPVFVKIGKFYHFSISTNNGTIDIIAEEFTFSIVRRYDLTGNSCCS